MNEAKDPRIAKEGTAKQCNVVEDLGTEVGGGVRCCSSTATICLSPRAKIVNKNKLKAYLTHPKSSLSESQAPPSQDAPPTPPQLLDRFLHRLNLTIHPPLAHLGRHPILAQLWR